MVDQGSVRLFYRKYRKQILICQSKKSVMIYHFYMELNTNPQMAFGQK